MRVIVGKFFRSLIPFKPKSNFVRNLSSSDFKLTENNVEEIEIPVPWGHIAGKWWGDRAIPPVLAIHGWQDNANSFDNLIPLLNVPSVLAIDLPGHGLSSHLVQGRTYDFSELIITMHKIKKYFNWEQMPLLTHSFGSAVGFAYASMFPGNVKWVINFECARTLMTLLRNEIHKTMATGIDTFLKIEELKKEISPPAYQLSKMIEMTIEGSLGSISSPEAALALLKRGMKEIDKPSTVVKDKTSSDLGDFITYEKEKLKTLSDEEREYISKVFLQLTGKWWGRKDKRPILCIHGWQDNANSFDTLIPHLSPEFSYLAIDLPGHGFSSHYPKGFFYKTYDSATSIRRIQKHFNWNTVSLIGHSYGAVSSFLFSSLFSNSVDFFVAIDAIKPLSKDAAKYIKEASKTIEKLLFYDSLTISSAPAYTRDDLVNIWIKGTNNSLTENSCNCLIERGTNKKENLFKVARDPRVKQNFGVNFTHKENLKLAEAITCNVLFLKAKGASYFENKNSVLEVLGVIKQKAKYFEEHMLTGTHHIHLNNPEVVAPVINSFIQTVGGQREMN